MAAEDAKKKRRVKKTETVREKANKAKQEKKTRRLSKTASKVSKPISAARRIGKKEYHPIKLPDSRLGRFLGKSRRWTPAFLRNSWQEMKLVTWPNRSETFRLTMAVIIFAIVFGALIAVADYGLQKLFREVLIT